jgi:hypothetical protein
MKQIFLIYMIAWTGPGLLYAQQAATKYFVVDPHEIVLKKNGIAPAAASVKMVSLPAMTNAPKMVKIDLEAQINKTRARCPFLMAKATLELEGEREDPSEVQLQWKTTNGWNNRQFIIERSLGDTLHFETVNSVWANETAGIRDKYQLPDENDFSKTSYYRLKLILGDGENMYSNIAAVKGYRLVFMGLNPNPAKNHLTLSLSADKEVNARMLMFDISGKLVWNTTSFLQEGMNQKELPIALLPAGLYTVRVYLGEGLIRTAKFVKQ